MDEPREVERALSYLDSNDREIWYRMAFAVRDALGEDGRAIWIRWSATSPKYDERTASQTWARVKPGPITAASLFGLAMQAGYRRNRDDALPPRRARPDSAKAEREAQHRQQRADDAATRAQAMLKQAEWAEHPYLLRKALGSRRVSGYRNDGPKGFVLDDALLVPMRSLRTGEVRAVQAIMPDGSRKFLPFGCSASECIHTIGPRGRVCWWVEGFATGLAVREALDAIYRQADRVVCCFSSGQLAKLPQKFSKLTSFVVADADWWRCHAGHQWAEPADACPECGGRASPPAGGKAAQATGLPWWEPDKPGTDGWDYAARYGVATLGRELLSVARVSMGKRLC